MMGADHVSWFEITSTKIFSGGKKKHFKTKYMENRYVLML